VRDYDIDLAVVGTHGRTGLMRLLMGSLAEELFRSLSCPVLTIGPHLSRRKLDLNSVNTILCPTDLSSESRTGFVNVAALACEFQAKIVVLHVIPGSDALSAHALEAAVEARRAAQRIFSPDVDPRCPLEIVVDFGDPAERILAAAREHHAAVIALGVRQAGEPTTHFRNTVAYRVVLEAECPVLTSRSPEKW
jgi:nucleotide-binding universal stress UspA family protein